MVTFVPDPVSESENMTPRTISMPSIFSSTISSSSSYSHLARVVYNSSMGVVPATHFIATVLQCLCNCCCFLLQFLLLYFAIVGISFAIVVPLFCKCCCRHSVHGACVHTQCICIPAQHHTVQHSMVLCMLDCRDLHTVTRMCTDQKAIIAGMLCDSACQAL